MDISRLKSISIVDYLSKSGHKPVNRTGKWISFYSPFSKEGNASFKVNTATNKFVDYHAGLKGDIIDLVCHVEHVSFAQACNILSESKGLKIEKYDPEKKHVPGIIIERVDDISRQDLIKYFVSERKVATSVLLRYCRQVTFSFPLGKYPERKYVAVGFPTSMGSWELRNKKQKVCGYPKSFTKINGVSEDKGTVNLFEGFMDFLSALTYFRVLEPQHDTYVLNGVGQINLIKPFLDGKNVNNFVDNDKAGDKVFEALRGYNVTDKRHFFEFYGDFNEKLKEVSSSERSSSYQF